jgi:hypothetical protein
MNTRRQYRKYPLPQQMYVVINKEGEAFTGLKSGYTQWSYDWFNAKPLNKENTSWLLRYNPGAELIKEEELI